MTGRPRSLAPKTAALAAVSFLILALAIACSQSTEPITSSAQCPPKNDGYNWARLYPMDAPTIAYERVPWIFDCGSTHASIATGVVIHACAELARSGACTIRNVQFDSRTGGSPLPRWIDDHERCHCFGWTHGPPP